MTRDGRTPSRNQEQWNASLFRPTAAAVDVLRLRLGVVVCIELARIEQWTPGPGRVGSGLWSAGEVRRLLTIGSAQGCAR